MRFSSELRKIGSVRLASANFKGSSCKWRHQAARCAYSPIVERKSKLKEKGRKGEIEFLDNILVVLLQEMLMLWVRNNLCGCFRGKTRDSSCNDTVAWPIHFIWR